MKKARVAAAAVVVLCVALTSPAFAIPALQIYIDGSSYDPVTESWITTASTFDIWIIGDVGGHASIFNVFLSAATFTAETGSITLTPTTASGLPPAGDPSTPGAPVYNGLSADGAIPIKSDGSALATHGVYGPGVRFHEWSLGDFTLTDSPIGDYITSFPAAFPSMGQVNVYTVTVTGYTAVHFDTYDTIEGKQHSSFGPFSHDGGTLIPEPGTWLLLSAGLLGLVGVQVRRKRA